MADNKINKERIRELLTLIIEERGKTQRREHVAVLYELLRPVLEGKRGKYYTNTGTWIPMLFLTRTKRKLRWRDLQNQEIYQQILTYCVVKKGLGGTAASLKRKDGHSTRVAGMLSPLAIPGRGAIAFK